MPSDIDSVGSDPSRPRISGSQHSLTLTKYIKFKSLPREFFILPKLLGKTISANKDGPQNDLAQFFEKNMQLD